jgi:hypothetical protein
MRTRCVSRLIYFPFIVLSLFLMSRNPFFDHWTMSGTGLVLMVLGACVALACALALRYAAEAARQDAIRHLSDEIMRERRGAGSAAAPHAGGAASQPFPAGERAEASPAQTAARAHGATARRGLRPFLAPAPAEGFPAAVCHTRRDQHPGLYGIGESIDPRPEPGHPGRAKKKPARKRAESILF